MHQLCGLKNFAFSRRGVGNIKVVLKFTLKGGSLVCRLCWTAAFQLALIFGSNPNGIPLVMRSFTYCHPELTLKDFFLFYEMRHSTLVTPEVGVALGSWSHYIQTDCFLLIWLDFPLGRDINNTISHGPFQVYLLLHRESVMPLKHQKSIGMWIYVSNLKSIGVPESFSVLFLTISNCLIKDISSPCHLYHDKAWI